MAVMLSIFAVLRICFWLYNFNQFPSSWSFATLLWYSFIAIRFDISALCYINALYWLFEILAIPFDANNRYFAFAKKITFLLPNFLFLIIEVSDIVFFSFQSRRMIFGDISLIANTFSMLPALMLRYWYVILLLLIFFYTGNKLYDKTEFWRKPILKKSWIKIVSCFWGLFIMVAIVIVGGRGGVQLRPITNNTASTYTYDTRWSPYILNSSFSVLSTSLRKGVKAVNYYTPEELSQKFSLEHLPDTTKTFQPLNVVVIAMESFGKEYSAKYNPDLKGKGYMPFLDSLSNYSLTAENSYANALRSTFGIVAITAGLPCMMNEPFMFSPYQNNQLESIASLLKKKGYYSAFYHGSVPGSMGFDKYSKSVGYDVFEDMSHYPNPKDMDGTWGIFDIPYFQYVAQKFDALPKPFHGMLFSLTSHEPYHVEPWFEQKYPQEEPLYRSVRYSDEALKRFFATASKMPWFENTLFVITADHTGRSMNEHFQTSVGRVSIPILYYFPKGNLQGVVKNVTQQIDILPSIMDYVHYNLPFNAFGQSIFSDKPNYAYMFAWDKFFIIDNQYTLTFYDETPTALFNYKNDAAEQQNMLSTHPTIGQTLSDALKARIQVHHDAMLHNRLISKNLQMLKTKN